MAWGNEFARYTSIIIFYRCFIIVTELAQCIFVGELWKKCVLTKLENYEGTLSRIHQAFNTQFNLTHIVDLSDIVNFTTEESWQLQNLIKRLNA